MQRRLAVLFLSALIFALAPAAFADDAEPAASQDAVQTETVAVEPSAEEAEAEAVETAEILQALGMDPLFAGSDREMYCHIDPCPGEPCPWQYPTCMSNGCCT